MKETAFSKCRALSLIFFLLAQPRIGNASISAPTSSVAFSPDGKLVLVMLCSNTSYDRNPFAKFPDGRVVDLHATFQKSGAYDIATLKPLWQVDWCNHVHRLLYSDDLRNVAVINIFGFSSGWAVGFYKDGKLIKTYSCHELLRTFKDPQFLEYTSSDWHTVWYRDFRLGADHRFAELSTVRRQWWVRGTAIDLGIQEFYTFDLATGAIIRHHSNVAWRLGLILCVPIVVLISTGFVARGLWRRVRRWDGKRGFPVIIGTVVKRL